MKRREVKVVAPRTLFILLLYAGLVSLLSNPASRHSHADAASAGTYFPSPFPVLPPWDAAVSPLHLELPVFLLTAVDLHGFSCHHLLTHQLAGELLSRDPLELASTWHFWVLGSSGVEGTACFLLS